MPPQFKSGFVIYRHWDSIEGLNEVSRAFRSLDELFVLCLQADPSLLVDRIVIDGADLKGDPHTVTLVFQSATMPDHPKDPKDHPDRKNQA